MVRYHPVGRVMTAQPEAADLKEVDDVLAPTSVKGALTSRYEVPVPSGIHPLVGGHAQDRDLQETQQQTITGYA